MPDLLKAAKFGGTSMADFLAMTRCAQIVKKDPDKKVLVVSATAGTTNLLTQLFDSTCMDEKRSILKQIRERHLMIAKSLDLEADIAPKITALVDELDEIVLASKTITPQLKDKLLSFGEMLSSVLFTEVVSQVTGEPVQWMDARDVIITDQTHTAAEPDIDEIALKAAEHLAPKLREGRVVTQGFIGSTQNGRTTTLGRGGSDYSAALFAEAINADVLEIWTDVTAVYTTDPRVVPDARPITEISFDEAAELSVFGAKVLHPATMVPAVRKNIRVYVGSSIQPEKPGTWILKDTKCNPVIRAISLRRDQTLITVHSLDMLHQHGFLARLFEVLSKHKISVDLVTTSEVSVSLTIDTGANAPGRENLNDEVIRELSRFCEVEIEENLSLIALVGNNLHTTSGLSGPVFGALENINVRLICHGASSHNLCFLVESQSAEDVVRVLHKKFITDRIK